MKLALSLHLFSAKVEMFNQMAMQRKIPETNCRAVADVAGQLTCNILEIDDLLKTVITNILKQIKYILYLIRICVCLFRLSRGQPLCFSS